MRPALLALIVLFLGAAGFGAAQFLETRRLRADADAWARERADLQQRLEALQKRNDRPRMPTADELRSADRGPARASSDEAGPTVVPTPNGANVTFRRGNEARFAMDLMNSPEVQRLMSIQQKAALDGRYAALFRSLNLNPAQLERFKELLVEKQAAVMDVMASAQAEGMLNRDNRGELRELVNETQAEIDAMIRSEIGERGFAQYKNYETTLPYRGTVDQLERRLSYSGAPLQPAQAEQLAQILAETSGNTRRRADAPVIGGAVNFVAAGAGPNVIAFGGANTISNDALVRAQGVLQPAQLDTLRTLQQEQLAAQQLSQQMREARSRARSGPATPAPPGTPGTPVPPPQPKG